MRLFPQALSEIRSRRYLMGFVTNPLFWLVLSFVLVSASLTLVLAVAVPTFRELSRVARSAEKLLDTLNRELPSTLESIRLTGVELTELTDEVASGVHSASEVVKQVDSGLTQVRQGATRVGRSGRGLLVGLRVAWRTFNRASSGDRRLDNRRRPRSRTSRGDRLSARSADPARIPRRVQQPIQPQSAQPKAASNSDTRSSPQAKSDSIGPRPVRPVSAKRNPVPDRNRPHDASGLEKLN
ncbi:MAG: hypothetical protein AAF728_00395 [Cyanobacteria bacterium P01_D01_bin.128]